MIWSEKELSNLGVISANVIIERIYKYIDDPKNADIFKKENFSYLWGMLGVAGIKGLPNSVISKVWQALKENDVIEAFDKGVLGDFNKGLSKKYKDNRLRAWINYDNFTADQKFKKLILMPIVAIKREYANEVDTQAFNPLRVLGVLERYPLSEPVKQMLIDMRGHGAATGISGQEVIEHYEKEKVLAKLCNIIAHSKRKFKEYEKDFFFRYIYDAVIDGFEYEAIGLNDFVFANLMTDETDDNLSELELAPIHERNVEIVEFAKMFDEKYGFYELTASKLIKNNHLNITWMIERCLTLMNKTDPKGVVFALELVNLKQLKSAARILIALARKGRATELASFLHRFLPEANGAETMIMSILKLNLKKLKEKEIFDKNEVFREYPARIYVLGVKQFVEYKFYKEATALLIELVENGWIDGFDDLKNECVDIANCLLNQDKSFVDSLRVVASRFDLHIYDEAEVVYLGDKKDNPISQVRKKAEKVLSDVTGFDVSSKLEKMANVEGAAYEVYQNIKNVFHKHNEKEDKKEQANSFDAVHYGEDAIDKIEEVLENDSNAINNNSEVNKVEEVITTKDETPKEEAIVKEIKEEPKDVEIKKDEITSWEVENNDNDETIRYENIIEIDEKEIDNHFEKIKSITSEVLKRAEQKAKEIKERVENKDIKNSVAISKIKNITNKFKIFKKK